jgi:hypothetical protein
MASGQNLHKVIEQIFSYELFCICAIPALLIFVAMYKLNFCAQPVALILL